MPDNSLESAFHAQLILVHGISQEILELLGNRQCQAFIGDILTSLPTIQSATELWQVTNTINQQSNRSLPSYQLNSLQMKALHQRMQILATQYLGKEYAPGVINDLFKQLPSHFKQPLIKWFESLQ